MIIKSNETEDSTWMLVFNTNDEANRATIVIMVVNLFEIE
jgi:hypothetical protein